MKFNIYLMLLFSSFSQIFIGRLNYVEPHRNEMRALCITLIECWTSLIEILSFTRWQFMWRAHSHTLVNGKTVTVVTTEWIYSRFAISRCMCVYVVTTNSWKIPLLFVWSDVYKINRKKHRENFYFYVGRGRFPDKLELCNTTKIRWGWYSIGNYSGFFILSCEVEALKKIQWKFVQSVESFKWKRVVYKDFFSIFLYF